MSNKGQLFVVSAPSGTGKTTVVERLVQVVPNLALSRSYTSRAARAGEVQGVDYNFVTRSRFEEMIAAGDFLEWADVFGNLYGTCASDTQRDLAKGMDVVLVIDVQGARQVRQQHPESVGIFVMPPSFEVLESRLRDRDITVLTLHRGAQVIANPRPGNVLEAEDRLLCFGKLEEMRSMIPERRKRQRKVKKLPKQPIHDV